MDRVVEDVGMANGVVSEITIVQTQAEYAEALASFQRLCFPTLPAEDLFNADHYRSHLKQFAEGQFTALAHIEGGVKVVGATTTMRADMTHLPAHFMEMIGHNWLTTHQPNGVWLYGIDMSVHPDYRRIGISRLFYAERAALVRRLGLRGEMVAGLLPGYEVQRGRMSIEAYVEAVSAGELTDPTLTPQLKNGFRVLRLLYGYVTDPRSDNIATLLVRENTEFIR
jgi:GNAT superfamily N-acetyltransferase